MPSNEKFDTIEFEINEELPSQKRNCNHRVLLTTPESDEVEDDWKKRLPNTNLGAVEEKFNSKIIYERDTKEQRVYLVGGSIIKHVNGYKISGKTETCKVISWAKVRCLVKHVKPVILINQTCHFLHWHERCSFRKV